MKKAKTLRIIYLTEVSINGSDKEAHNVSSIKKIRKNDGKDYPYCSLQTIKRALREQILIMLAEEKD